MIGQLETILIADDEDAVRRVVSIVLGEAGYRIVEARDGAEASAAFERDPDAFDLVLLDAVMPNKSGPDAARAMRAIRPKLPIIISSGYADALAPDGGDGLLFLAKPYDLETLLRTVRSTLDAARE